MQLLHVEILIVTGLLSMQGAANGALSSPTRGVIKVASFAKGKDVWGVAVMNGDIFAIRKESSVVEVYDADTLQNKYNITVDGLLDPVDITSSATCNLLYIADFANGEARTHRVHTVEVSGEASQSTSSWRFESRPVGLSTARCYVIVATPYQDGNYIFVFRPDGTPLSRVNLRGHGRHLHAVVTPNDTLIASFHSGRSTVCEFNPKRVDESEYEAGTALNCYGGQDSERLFFPGQVTIDKVGSVYVVDVSLNKIIKLDSSMNFVKDAVKAEEFRGWEPAKIALDETGSVSFMYVALHNGKNQGKMLKLQLN